MQNSWNDVNGTAGGAKQQTQKSDTIDSVIDAFKNVAASNSGALLNDWNLSEKKMDGYKPKGGDATSRSNWGGTIGATSNQDDNENSWSAWDNNDDNNNGWNNEDSNGRNYSANEYQDSGQLEYAGGWETATTMVQPSQQPQQQQHSPSPSESDTSTDQNSETMDPNAKILAWHSIADPNAKERDDGIGGGQLHRRGRNYKPLDEATVLAIQQKGGNKKNYKKGSEKFIPSKNKNIPIIPQSQTGKPPIKPSHYKSATPLKQSFAHNNTYIPPQKAPNTNTPVKTPVPQNQRQNTQHIPPNRSQQQTLQKPSQLPSQSSQAQPTWDSQPLQAQPTWDSQPSQDSLQPSRPQRTKQTQTKKTQQPQHSWDAPQLVNEPFWEMPATSSPSPTIQNESLPPPRSHTNEVQSQPLRHQSPARSPRPTKPAQDHTLPFIPPEFDSTPYRKQPSPSPIRDIDISDGYNGPANECGDYKNYEKDNDDEYRRNEYYEEESDVEGQEDKFNYDDRRQESEGERAPRTDRGQLLLTINVELSDGKTHPITVHVFDDPDDLAKDFCDMWEVTNPMVKPALACLINEEKDKRLAIN